MAAAPRAAADRRSLGGAATAPRDQIDVEGGRITLLGDVQSWREREAVIGAVTGTRGVESVLDRLRVS